MEKKAKDPGGSGALLVLAIKFKKLLAIFKSALIFKPLLTIGSMALSLLAYAPSLGWRLALGLLIMVFIHEMGHVIALRQKGIPASAPVFIPFLGAAVFAPRLTERPEDEAYVGYGGPLLGGIAALLLFLYTLQADRSSTLLLTTCCLAAQINLFNMIPVRPLDGGRITQIISEWRMTYAGVATLLAALIYLRSPTLLLISILMVDYLPLSKRSSWLVSCGLAGIMTIMICLRIGQAQPLWMNVTDIVLAIILCLSHWISYTSERRKIERGILEPQELRRSPVRKRKPIPLAVRVKWLLYYLALTGSLVWLTVATTQHLHAALRHQ